MLAWSACAAVFCTGRLAFGALDTSAATTLTLNRNNTGGYVSSLTNAAHWTANAGGTATAPQLMDADISANPDAAGYDYYVGNNYSLRTFKIDDAVSPYAGKLITFGGRSLHVGPGVFLREVPLARGGTAFPRRFKNIPVHALRAHQLHDHGGILRQQAILG